MTATEIMHCTEAQWSEAQRQVLMRFFKTGKQDMDRLTNVASKELVTVKGATHCDLYDGGEKNYIPFDRIAEFYREYLK